MGVKVSHVAALRNKSAKETGDALLQILSTAVIPAVLQSDNGGEFLGYCINMVHSHFPGVHLVRGRAQHPQSQGSVEHGNAPFKELLQKWMQENNDGNWPKVGIFVVNASLNQ